MCMLCEENRFADSGRREAESVAGGGEDLIESINTSPSTVYIGSVRARDSTYMILAEEDRGPSKSDVDISGRFPNGKLRFPVEDRNGASRAMVCRVLGELPKASRPTAGRKSNQLCGRSLWHISSKTVSKFQ